MPDTDVEHRDEPAASRSHALHCRAVLSAAAVTPGRISRPRIAQTARTRRPGFAPRHRRLACTAPQRAGRCYAAEAPPPCAPRGSRPQSTALPSKAESPTVAVNTSALSRELPAGFLPAAALAQPSALGGHASWARRLAQAFRRPEQPDTWPPNLLSREGPEFEGVQLLGDAWRSPVATAVRLGRHFDLVEVSEAVASHAWHHLRRRGVQCGAVLAAGDRWSFVVPARSAHLPWPVGARYLTGCFVSIPARCARDETHGLWWISRPPSGPFTPPHALVPALEHVAGAPSGTPRVPDPAWPPTAGRLSPPLRSSGV